MGLSIREARKLLRDPEIEDRTQVVVLIAPESLNSSEVAFLSQRLFERAHSIETGLPTDGAAWHGLPFHVRLDWEKAARELIDIWPEVC